MRNREVIKKDVQSKVVEITRVTRVVAGGKRMRFRALVVVGDRKGRVGIGVKKGADVAEAVGKATNEAKKKMITVTIVGDTIPRQVKYKFKAAKIILKPRGPGSGIIAGGPVRAVVDMAGIKNVSSKMLGSSNKVSNVRAAFEALKQISNVQTAGTEAKN